VLLYTPFTGYRVAIYSLFLCTARRSPASTLAAVAPVDPFTINLSKASRSRACCSARFSWSMYYLLMPHVVALACFFLHHRVPARCCCCCCSSLSLDGRMRGLLSHRYHHHRQPQSTESQATALIVVASVIGLAFSVIQFMLIASVKWGRLCVDPIAFRLFSPRVMCSPIHFLEFGTRDGGFLLGAGVSAWDPLYC